MNTSRGSSDTNCAAAVPSAKARNRSPIRWAGSKQKLLPVLPQYWRPTDNKYIEAFAGSARLFFYLKPDCAVLNDMNSELISALRNLVSSPREIYSALSDLPIDSETYYRIRSSDSENNEHDAAVRFFYLNRNCFNGIYRTNKKGKFNVPFGRKTGMLPSLEQWTAASETLRNATLESEDFEAVVKRHVEKGDFVYMDPPYAVANRRIFRQYSATEFGTKRGQVHLSRGSG